MSMTTKHFKFMVDITYHKNGWRRGWLGRRRVAATAFDMALRNFGGVTAYQVRGGHYLNNKYGYGDTMVIEVGIRSNFSDHGCQHRRAVAFADQLRKHFDQEEIYIVLPNGDGCHFKG